MTDLLRDDELKTKRAEKPSTRWRNKWRCAETARYRDTRIVSAGDVIWGANIHPTFEVAEQRAREAQAAQIAAGFQADTWLGAFPLEGEGS